MCKIIKVDGVLDRFSDRNLAVILIEEINKEVIISTDKLPPGSKANTWFNIQLKDDEIVKIVIDDVKTDKKAQKSTNLMEQLRSKSKKSKFKRK